MIRLTDLVLTYPDGPRRLTALDGVSLTAEPGRVTAVTGPSGSGKSSLLAVASTLIRPDAGRVEIAGVEATALDPAEAAELRRTKLGIVFQQPELLPALTAIEQLLVMGRLAGGRPGRAARRAERERAGELLDAVGLADQAGRRPNELSGGQRQRVGIARALMHSPAALLVDEPTSALDQERGAAVVELLVSLTRDLGTATLLVTHDLVHLPALDREVRLVDGRIVADSAVLAA